MKKFQIIAVLILIMMNAIQVMSQEDVAKSEKKWSTELNFNPFNGSLSLNNTSGQIKIRRFLNDGIALRAGILIDYKSFNENTEQKYTAQPYSLSNKRNSLQTTINFGIEKHFNKKNRLSPYIGAEVGFGVKTAKQEFELDTKKRSIKGAWINSSYNGNYYSESFVENNFTSVGANLLTGFDFYMTENFYFGYEFGLSAEFFKYGKIEVTEDEDYSSNSMGTVPEMKSSTWRIAPKVINGIRIGYIF